MCCHCAAQNFTGMKRCCCHAAREVYQDEQWQPMLLCELYQVIPVNYRTCRQWPNVCELLLLGMHKKGEHLCSPFHYINCLIKLLPSRTPE